MSFNLHAQFQFNRLGFNQSTQLILDIENEDIDNTMIPASNLDFMFASFLSEII